MMVMRYSKNQKQAMEFLKWFHSTDVYDKWFNVQKGFATGPTKQWENHKMWQEDPVMAPYRVAPGSAVSMAMRDRRDRRLPKCSPSTSSSTCTPRPSRACPPRTR